MFAMNQYVIFDSYFIDCIKKRFDILMLKKRFASCLKLTRLGGRFGRLKTVRSKYRTWWNTTGYVFESSAFIIKCNLLFPIMKLALKTTTYIVSFYSTLL